MLRAATLAAVSSLLALDATAAPQQTASVVPWAGAVVASVEVTSSWDALLPTARDAVAGIRPGDTYQVAEMRRALQNLYALGAIANVRVEATPGPGGLALRFVIEPQTQFWDVRFTGDLPWRKSKLRDALSLREGAALDAESAAAQAARLAAALGDDGYLLAAVSGHVIEGATPTRGVLELRVVPGSQARLAAVKITGDGGVSNADLRAALALPIGGAYRPAAFEAGLDRVRARLLASNFFFHKTRVVEQSMDLRDNSMALEIEVTVGPRVLLDISGVPFSDAEMRARLAIFEFGTVDDWALKDTRHALVRWLQERGHWRPLVSYSRERDAEGRNVSVDVRVLAGQRAKLARIDFTGNARVAAANLLAAIRSTPAGFLAPRRFISEWWEEDQRAVLTTYLRRGFRAARIVDTSVDYDADAGGVVATMAVEEGPQSLVEAVEVFVDTNAGPAPELDTVPLANSLGLRAGLPFDPGAVRRDTDRLRGALANNGFPRALVASSTEPGAEGIRVIHRVTPGSRQLVSTVLVAGNNSTRDRVIERELAFARGGPMSFGDQLDTQSRLYATGLFTQVDVGPALPDDLATEQPVVVRVQEAPPLFITYGAGFDTEEKVRGTFAVGHNNIGGRNQELSFSTRASLREQRFRVLFREPYFVGRRTEGTATAFYTNEQQVSFRTQRYGVSFQLLFEHGRHFASLPRLVFRDTSTFDVEIDPNLIRPEDQSTRVGGVTYSFIIDTRSNPINPRDGFYGTTDIEVASRVLGSNTNFTTLLGRWFGYRGLGERLTLALGVRAGIKIPYGTSDSIPLPERFFAGGSTTLRGFRLDGAGPVDGNGNPLGGRVLLIGNIELRAQLWGDLGAVAFADVGNVFALPQAVRWGEVRETLGVGVRYATPVGPIRLDLARLMDRRAGEDEYQLFFSIGHTF
jgi:outer membrane protein assembly complex protein YaeT